MTRTLVVLNSFNAKTGPAAVTYRQQSTCPTSCVLLANGCYARGRLFALSERRGVEDDLANEAIRDMQYGLPRGGLVRSTVTGDILDDDGQVDVDYLGALSTLAQTRPDADVYGYTHAWRETTSDVAPGVTLNASCETEAELEEAAAAGWPTVVVDPGDEDTLIGSTVAGRKVIRCPQETHGITCARCRLCAKPDRKSTVAFVAHSAGKAKAVKAVKEARS